MNDPEGLYKMMFVGRPNGELMKGAPKNYIHGEIYDQPFKMSRYPFWKMIDPVPVLMVPSEEKGESVFDDAVFIPDEKPEVEMTPPPMLEGVNVDPDAPAMIEPYMTLNLKTGKVEEEAAENTTDAVKNKAGPQNAGEERERLTRILDEGGVKYSKRARLSTLKRMVESLEAEKQY